MSTRTDPTRRVFSWSFSSSFSWTLSRVRHFRPIFLAISCFALLTGCGEGVRDSHADVGVEVVVGPTGGAVMLSTIRLTVPAEAVDHDISISVRRGASDYQPVLGDVATLAPDTVTLAVPATVSIALYSTLPVALDRVTLGVLASASWRPVSGSEIDSNGWISAPIVQLTTYAPVVLCGSNEACASGHCDAGVCQL